MPEKKRVALVDLSHAFRRHWHATGDQEVNRAADGVLQEVRRLTAGYDHVAIAIDSPPYIRADIYPEYKAQREKTSQVMIGQLDRLKDRLSKEGFWVVGDKGHEADDIIATLAKYAAGKGCEVSIFSGDSDLFQCLREGVKCINPATGTVTEAKAMPYAPTLVPEVKALIGDTSDNIAGIKGVGPKTAAAWIAEYGSLNGIISAAGDKQLGRHSEAIAQAATHLRQSMVLLKVSEEVKIDCEELWKERKLESLTEEEITSEDLDAPDIIAVDQSSVPAVRHVEFERGLEPQTAGNAWKLAKILFESRVFPQHKSPNSILAVILRGRNLGLGAIPALQGFYVMEQRGVPQITASASLLIGLVKRHPVCEYFQCTESSADKVVWVTHRKGNPRPSRLEWTAEDAFRNGFTDPKRYKSQYAWEQSNWYKQPRTMLRWRCGTELARMEYPDVTSGLYAAEEFQPGMADE